MEVHSYPTVPVDPLSFWRAIHPDPQNGFLLGSGAGAKTDPIIYMSLEEPTRIYKSNKCGDFDPLCAIENILSQCDFSSSMPRFVGILSFDAGRSFDPGIGRLPMYEDQLGTPRAFFGDYHSVLKVDYLKKKTTVVSSNPEKIKQVGTFLKRNRIKPAAPIRPSRKSTATRFHRPSPTVYASMIKRAKEAISNGDIYQANLSIRFWNEFRGDPLEFYRCLCHLNPSPYACLMKQGDQWIASCSPELLIHVNGDKMTTRPIAGTRPRGKTRHLDHIRQGQLLLSPKERAEHIMLVDLERNDLGRVAMPGSVQVVERFTVERYSDVMHIVSEVQGRLKRGRTAVDAVRAVFPGGTITGCPKIKSIEIIEGLEGTSRGPFYGSAGFFSWNGDACFNLLIRTALIKNNLMYIQAGAGIVADSNPKREYREVLAKAKSLLRAATYVNASYHRAQVTK